MRPCPCALALFGLLTVAACDAPPGQPEPIGPRPLCGETVAPMAAVAVDTQAAWLGVWAPADDAVWVVGGTAAAGRIARYDGQRLAPEAVPAGLPLWWIWGASQAAIWAVGDGGRILRRQPDATWQPEPSPVDDRAVLWGVWGSSPTDLWAVGGSNRRGGPKGLVLRSAGDGVWRRITDPALPLEQPDDPLAGLNLYKVWGQSADAVWLVGEGGVTVRYNGQAFERLDAPDGALLFTTHGRADGPVLAVGGLGAGAAFSWREDGWQPLPLGPLSPLNGVALWPTGGLMTGDRGSLLHEVAGQWCRQRPDPAWSTRTLHAATRGPSHRWVVGGDLTQFTAGVVLTDAPVQEVSLP